MNDLHELSIRPKHIVEKSQGEILHQQNTNKFLNSQQLFFSQRSK